MNRRSLRDAARIVALVTGLLGTSARAADYYVEGPANQVKSEASATHKTADEAGVETRIVRRYVEGQGWRYFLVGEGFHEEAAARSAGASLASAIGADVKLYVVEGKDARVLDTLAGGKKIEEPVADELDPEVAKILARATEALGGGGGGGDIIAAARSVRFEYSRSLEGGLEAKHLYVRRGADQALTVRISEGDGVDSETRLVGGTAWLRTGREGAFTSQDAERGAELLQQASPTGMVPLVLVFADAVASRAEFSQLVRDGTTEVDGETCDRLRFAGDRSSGAMTLEISQSTGMVRKISFENGELVHQFDDYTQIANHLVVPKKIRTWKEGRLSETTEIVSLQLEVAIPESLLAMPERP